MFRLHAPAPMTRYTSPPEVHVEIERNGQLVWEKSRRVVEIDPDHSVRLYGEVLETSSGYIRPPTLLHGTVTHLIPGKRLSVTVRRDDSDKAITIDAVAGTGELIGELFSPFTGSGRGIILTPEASGDLFPPPLPTEPLASQAEVDRPEPTPPPSPAPPRAPAMTLAPEAPVSGDEFEQAWTRLNRHLRRHGGRSASLKKAQLSDPQREFLEALFSGPLAELEHDALEDLRDFYAADEGRRIHVNVTSLTLPEEPGGPWEIVLGESRWGGVVIVHDVTGWVVTDRTLIG